jgi:pimeloyl-ACP methyl ester carboxylesterase
LLPDWVPEASIVRLDRGRGEQFVRLGVGGVGGAVSVVLLHGWMATADVNFFAVYRELGGRRPFVAPDLRGHGRSMISGTPMTLADAADDVVALLDALGHRRALVCGYSMGGAVAQQLAVRHPDRIAGMVLSGTALHWAGPLHALLLWRAGWDGTLQRLTTGRFAGRLLAQRAARTSPLAASVADWVVDEMERGHPGHLRDAGRSLARHDSRPHLDALRAIPSVVVVTEGDHLVPARRQRRLAAAIGASTVSAPGGHDAPAAHGERWASTIADALDEVEAAALRRL